MSTPNSSNTSPEVNIPRSPKNHSNKDEEINHDDYEDLTPQDAEEEFEVVPDAKKLPQNQDLEAVGKPYAGERAAKDRSKEEQEEKKGEQGVTVATDKSYWSKEGGRSSAGGKK